MNNDFQYTSAIGIGIGGASQGGNYADSVLIYNNHFVGVPYAHIAPVNAEHALVIENRGDRPGREGFSGGVSGIDIETNFITNHAAFIGLYNNQFDYSQPAFDHIGNAINVQNAQGGSTSLVHDITVANNLAPGGDPSVGTSRGLSNGIVVAGPIGNLFVANNYVTKAGQSCIQVYGGGGVFQDNQCISTGSGGPGGNYAIELISVQGVQVLRNLIYDAPNTQVSTGPFIYEENSSGNTYAGNTVCVIYQRVPQCP